LYESRVLILVFQISVSFIFVSVMKS